MVVLIRGDIEIQGAKAICWQSCPKPRTPGSPGSWRRHGRDSLLMFSEGTGLWWHLDFRFLGSRTGENRFLFRAPRLVVSSFWQPFHLYFCPGPANTRSGSGCWVSQAWAIPGPVSSLAPVPGPHAFCEVLGAPWRQVGLGLLSPKF